MGGADKKEEVPDIEKIKTYRNMVKILELSQERLAFTRYMGEYSAKDLIEKREEHKSGLIKKKSDKHLYECFGECSDMAEEEIHPTKFLDDRGADECPRCGSEDIERKKEVRDLYEEVLLEWDIKLREHNMRFIVPNLNLWPKPELFHELDTILERKIDQIGMSGMKEDDGSFVMDVSIAGTHDPKNETVDIDRGHGVKECEHLIKYNSNLWTCGKDMEGPDGKAHCGRNPDTGEFVVYRDCPEYEPADGKKKSLAEGIITKAMKDTDFMGEDDEGRTG